MILTRKRPSSFLRRGGFASLCVAALVAACAQPGGAPRMAVGVGGADQDGPLVVIAGGRQVIVAPPPGFCIDRETVQDQGDAVFVLIEDCALLGIGGDADAALVNGLVTLSIGAAPLFDGEAANREAASERLERFLRSDEGRATVGMGGGPDDITIIETRRFDGVLFMLVEDQSRDAAPILSPRLWRAFTELNDRAAIAALSVFESSAIGDATMLSHLARVVAALKRANGDKVGPEEAQLALAAPRPRKRPAPDTGRNVRVSANGISVPMPARRPSGGGAAVGDPAAAQSDADATANAPTSAPRAASRAKRS
jgi:hypothetical protein